MSFRISNNRASLTAIRHLDKAQRQTEKSLQSLASGKRIVSAGDDAAGFAISETLRGQLAGMKQATHNVDMAKSMVQTAEGGLNEQNNILIRMRELAIYAASDTVGEKERGFLNEEFQLLAKEFDRVAHSTTFGHKQLLTGDGKTYTFHVGANQGEHNTIDFKMDADTRASQLYVDDLTVDDQSYAKDAIETIDEALGKVASARSKFGAAQSRFQYAVDHLSSQRAHVEEARSLIADVDVAEEVVKLTKSQVLQDMGTSVLAQANNNSQRVLRLLGS